MVFFRELCLDRLPGKLLRTSKRAFTQESSVAPGIKFTLGTDANLFHRQPAFDVGAEWLVDAEGCPADRLRNLSLLRQICDQIIHDLELTVVGVPQWHQFAEPAGVTGLYLLSESHLACHTYPEYGVATFNLYCCRPRQEWPWEEQLTNLLAAGGIRIRSASRGNVADSTAAALNETTMSKREGF